MNKIKLILITSLTSLIFFGCSKDYLETSPTASISEEEMTSSLSGIETIIEGIHRNTYYFHGAHDKFGQKAVDYIIDCLGDDFYPMERGYSWFVSTYQWIDHRNIQSSTLEWVWSYYYDIINNANFIIKNLKDMELEELYIPKKNNILAQAYTYRAYSLYYLVQLYSEGENGVPIPIVPNPDPLPRSSVSDVYAQINNDLNEAEKLFTEGKGNQNKRPNVSHINEYVTYAIKARVSLTQKNWKDAIKYSEYVIKAYPLCKDYMYGWNKANEEWVWGAVLIDEQQTSYASFFSHMDPFFGGYCTLGNHHVMSESVFNFLKDSDTRKILHQPLEYFGGNDYNTYFGGKPRSSFKFTGMKEWTNDYIYVKSGEMYLIAAEAYYMDKNEGKAKDILDELNKARTIDGAEFTGTDKTGNDLLNEILMYRRAELWGDGQRFLDMKRLNIGCEGRTGQPLAELTHEIKAGDKRFTFLIPKQEMDSNPNMKQNTL